MQDIRGAKSRWGQAKNSHPVRFVAVGAHDGLFHSWDALLSSLQEPLQLIQGEPASIKPFEFANG